MLTLVSSTAADIVGVTENVKGGRELRVAKGECVEVCRVIRFALRY